MSSSFWLDDIIIPDKKSNKEPKPTEYAFTSDTVIINEVSYFNSLFTFYLFVVWVGAKTLNTDLERLEILPYNRLTCTMFCPYGRPMRQYQRPAIPSFLTPSPPSSPTHQYLYFPPQADQKSYLVDCNESTGLQLQIDTAEGPRTIPISGQHVITTADGQQFLAGTLQVLEGQILLI